MTELQLRMASLAEESGFLAMRDVAVVAEGAGIEYRIVGGQMVRLHVARAGIAEPAARITLDADMGIAAASARNPELVVGLERLGYARPRVSNRFVRQVDGLRLVIDVLAPASGRKMVPNQQYGDIILDEIPGLSLALASPGEQLTLRIARLDGTDVTFDVTVPSLTPSLCLKALGWSDRLAPKDAIDVWRLLRAHNALVEPVPWRADGVQGDAAAILRDDFARPNGAGMRVASTDHAERAEIRALTLAVLSAAPQG